MEKSKHPMAGKQQNVCINKQTMCLHPPLLVLHPNRPSCCTHALF
jgi:hypothetical protein